jgi:transposase
MANRELNMYTLKDSVELILAGMPIKKIARLQKISKNTVKKYRNILETILEVSPDLKTDISKIMVHFSEIRKEERYSENFLWIEKNQELINNLSGQCDNYIVLIQKLKENGFNGSYSSLLRYISKYKYTHEEPVYRIETKPGDYAQVDFGYMGQIYDKEKKALIKAWVFVMVLCYSRDAYYEIVKSQDIKNWCNCHINAFEYFGGVPKIIIPDNLKSAIIKAAFMDPLANRSYADLSKHYNFQIDPCLPGTPKHKGKVESGVKYVKNNFLPLKTFFDFSDANNQLKEWNKNTARGRIHGTTRQKPEHLFFTYEKQALITLNPDRFEVPEYKEPKVYRDIHIQFNKAYYSVPYKYRGQRVLARGTTSQIAIFNESYELIAVHIPGRPGKRRTKMEHYPPDEFNYMRYDSDYCMDKALEIGENTLQVLDELLHGGVIRNLRSAQNIIRMTKKYGKTRLEAACKRAVFFKNYTYAGIKSILEKELDKQPFLFDEENPAMELNSHYARNIKKMLMEVTHGNICTNQK